MRHFSHEFKSVLRDYAIPLALPTLVVAGSLYLCTVEWARDVAGPGTSPGIVASAIHALIAPAWPYLEKALRFGGWVIPFLVLKNADIHDLQATWKARPVSRQVVFTTRFLLLALALVVLPAATTWAGCHLSWPEIAGAQTVTVAGAGIGMILVGAFAAMIAPGRRGIAILGGLAATAYAIAAFGPDTAKWILNRQVLHLAARDYSVRSDEYVPLADEWMAMVTLLTLAALVTPWIVLRIVRSGRPPRVLPWFAVTGLLGVTFQAALFLSPARRTPMRGPVLPPVSIELKDRKNRPEPHIRAMDSGYDLGSGTMRLPAEDLRIATDEPVSSFPAMWAPRQGRRRIADMTGNWETDTIRGRIEEHFYESRPGVSASWYQNEWGAKPNQRGDDTMNDCALCPLAKTLGVPVVKIWTALDCAGNAYPCQPTFAWTDSAGFRRKPQLVGFDFAIPFRDSKPGEACQPVTDPKRFRGKTLRFRADMQLVRDLPPAVWLRVPALRGGEQITSHEMIRIDPAEPGDRQFSARGAFRRIPLQPWNKQYWAVNMDERTECLLFNAARGEGVFLLTTGYINWGLAPLTLPKNAPTLTDDWVAGAEIIVLKYRSEPVVLPVEGALNVMH